VLLVAWLRKKEYKALKKIATWAAIATTVVSFAIAALNVKLPNNQGADPYCLTTLLVHSLIPFDIFCSACYDSFRFTPGWNRSRPLGWWQRG
jgi:hypothetical protein